MPDEPGLESRSRKAANLDGTARRQARAALEASERFLRESQRVAGVGSYDFDVAKGCWRSSAVMDEIFGIGPAYERTVDGWLNLIHADDREDLKRYLLQEVVGGGLPFDREYRIRTCDTGTVKWVHGRGQLETDAAGRPVRMLGTIQDITERKRAAAALAESERTYREIFNATNDALFIHAEDGRIVDVNVRMCTMFGCTHDQALALSLSQMSLGTPPYSATEAAASLRRALAEGPQLFPWRSRRCDGGLFWTEVALRACRIAGQMRVIATVRDISERRQVEDALAASEARFRQLFDLAKDAIFLADAASGLLIDANHAAERMTGRPRAELIGLHQLQLHPADQQDHYRTLFCRTILNPVDSIVQGELVTADGRRLPVEINANVIVQPDGRRVVQGIFRDISERRRAEVELRRSERRLALAISATADAIWDWDLVTDETYYSPRWFTMLGHRDQELPMTFATWSSLCHPDDLQRAIDRIAATRANPGSAGYLVEFRMRHRDGSWRWIQGRGNVVERDAGGRAVRMSGTNSDITEHKRTEAERDRLFNLSQDLLCVCGYDGFLKQVNPAWTRLLGWTEEELTARPWLQFVHPDDQAATIAAGGQLVAGEEVRGFENRYRCKDGSYRLLSWNSTPLVDDRLIFAVVRDLTDVRRNQERLRHMEKMDAIGQLAGGVAHDFNNQLGAIMGFAEMLEKRLDDPTQRRFAQNILTATRRSADLTGQLLAFARKGQYLQVPVDIHAVIGETIAILARSVDRRIHFQQLLKAHPAQVAGDPTQLQNALLNLALNARDAMPEGGLLTFETAVVHLTADEAVHLGGELGAGDHCEVRVSDTGCGMDDEVKAHLFEPFFTTKGPGKGTGMGLAAVYGTVRNHGGAIIATSVVGRGTSFRILLPLLRTQPVADQADQMPSPRLRRLGILIIDDEPMLRDLLGEQLEDEGHRVFRAANGEEGTSLFAERRQDIDLVILDLVMPAMNGRDCFRALKAVDPAVRVLLASGYSIDGEAQSILAEGALGFIQKPFQKADLMHRLVELMG